MAQRIGRGECGQWRAAYRYGLQGGVAAAGIADNQSHGIGTGLREGSRWIGEDGGVRHSTFKSPEVTSSIGAESVGKLHREWSTT